MLPFITLPLKVIHELYPEGRVQFFLDEYFEFPDNAPFKYRQLVVFSDKVFKGTYVPYYDSYYNHIFMVVEIGEGDHIGLVCVDDENIIVDGMVHDSDLVPFQMSYTQAISLYHKILDIFKTTSKNNGWAKIDNQTIAETRSNAMIALTKMVAEKDKLVKVKANNHLSSNHIISFANTMGEVAKYLNVNNNIAVKEKDLGLVRASAINALSVESTKAILTRTNQTF